MTSVAEVITLARRVTADFKDETSGVADRWTDDEYLSVLNEILVEMAQDMALFNDEETIEIFDGQAEYEYSESLVEILQIRVDNFDGGILLPSSLQNFEATGRHSVNLDQDPFNTFTNSDSGRASVFFMDFVNYGKIRLDPVPSAETVDTDITLVWVP